MNLADLLDHAANVIARMSRKGISVEVLENVGCFSGFEEDTEELDATQLHTGEWVETKFDELNDQQKAALWEMIQKSYSGLEGGAPVKKPSDLLNPKYELVTLWDKDDDNIPNAFRFQRKKPAGMKMFMSGTDGSAPARDAAKKKLVSMLQQPGWYAELSDAPAHVVEKAGLHRWDDEEMVRKTLEGEDITWLGNGFYERDITGVGRHRKALYGRPFGEPLP